MSEFLIGLIVIVSLVCVTCATFCYCKIISFILKQIKKMEQEDK